MDENKTVFVDEETYNHIIQELGYSPSNLVLNRFITKGQAFVMNDEQLNTPFFKGYKPDFYFKK